uniref:Uncharacterized protein n=1 Tax=Anguilla anguilla TaxID=7936 RepID=A0A0E9PPL9_ANGAN
MTNIGTCVAKAVVTTYNYIQ